MSSQTYGFQQADQHFHLRQFTDENGLPQNSIQGMTLDNSGFLWVATQGGLARFDGQKIVSFGKKDLSVDSDRFVKFKTEMRTGTVYAVNEFRQLVSVRDGAARYDKRYASDYAMDLAAVRNMPASISPKIVVDTTRNADSYMRYRVIYGAPGRYYLYADQKIGFFERGVLTASIPFEGKPNVSPLPAEPHLLRRVIKETKGEVYIDNLMAIGGNLFYHEGSEGVVLSKVSKDGVKPMELRGEIERHPLFSAMKKQVRIITNRFKAQAFAYLPGCVYLITYSEATGMLDTRLLVDGLDIDQKLIYRMIYDETNQTLFMGSLSQGLFVIVTDKFRTVGYAAKKEFNNFFYSQLPYSDSTVLIPEGFVVSEKGVMKDLGKFFRQGKGTLNFGMLSDRRGDIWVIKSDSICQLNGEGKVKNIWRTGKHPERLYEGLDGRIWIGLRTGELAWLPPSPDASSKLQTMANVKGWCTFLYQDRPDRIWIGTNVGLFLCRLGDKKVFPVSGLRKKNVRSMYASRPDELWITTYGDGIFLLTGNKLIKMPLDDEQYLAYPHCMLEDGAGHFWIPTNKGLFRVAKEDLIQYAARKLSHVLYLYYNKDYGFLTNEFNGGCQPCGLKLGNGYFSFPSMNGLVWFKPEKIPLPALNAPLVLETFKLDEQPLAASDTIRLSYDFGHLSIGVTSPFMGLPENLDFYYKLEKSPSKTGSWIKLGNDRRIDLYRQGAGTYTLIVRKAAGFGPHYIEKRLVLIVGQPWFVSWWFILLAVLALSLVVWLFTKWRLRNLTKQNILLSRKVDERTVHLSKTLDELKASDDALQTQLQIQMRIIGAINHDLHTPLKYLSIYVPQYIEQVASQPDSPDTIRLGSSIGKSTLKVYRLADELLMFIKATYQKKGQITYEAVPIMEVLETKAQFFAELAHENEASITIDSEPRHIVTTNRVMVEILVHNLIDNALKHSFAHSVRLASRRDNGRVVVTIKDSGTGMYSDIIEWLNNDAQQTDNSAPLQPPPGLGLGLIIVREITMLLGIGMRTDSTPSGTTITLDFPE